MDGWSGCEGDALLASNLLATKLRVPRAQPGFVPRLRLARQLEEGLTRGLILVCAPAGSGKTSLVASWARTGSRPVAWLSLDPGDNDPARFWRHLFAALDLALPGVGARVAPLLSVPEPPPSDVLVTVLVNDVLAGDDVVLVLDDYHVMDSEPVHRAMAFLAENLPPVLRLVLASRSEPPLPLARLRARGQVAEVDAASLRFTLEEAAALLADLPQDVLRTLTERTEGWAAGLRLAALSLRGHGDAARFVAGFTGSHRYVLDYLTSEVLDTQPSDIRLFLLRTSVLDRLSGPLCDAVTGRTDGQEMLERIERAGLFLIPLDDVRGWWRYHHLFTDLLRARLAAAVEPFVVRESHAAAARWHDQHGLADDAIRHAVASGDVAEAARLIERYFDEGYLTGERATIQRWLSAVPATVALERPRLRLAQTFAALVYGDVEGAAALLDGSEPAADPGEVFMPSVGEAASLLVNVPAAFVICRSWLAYLRGEPDAMASFAARARVLLGEGELMLENVYQLNLALADWLNGRMADAERGFIALVARWRSAGETSLAARCCRFLGQVQSDQARLDTALRTYRQLVTIAEDPDRPRWPVAGYGYVGMAEIAYQRDELDDALRHVTEGIARCRRLSENEPLASGFVTLAWIRQASGDHAGALAALDEAERFAPSPAVANLLNPIPAQRARLLLAQGDLAAVAQWASSSGLSVDDKASYLREQEHLVLVRLLLARAEPDPALALLGRLHQAAACQERTGSLIQVLALRALALAAAGSPGQAVEALREALTLARPQGYVRVFADEGAVMASLLARVDGVPADYVARVLRACGVPPRISAQPLVDPLTSRELEVLALLAAGRPNQGIADQLVVTLDTVKKHVTHVLAKLGVTNRTEAVARARQLGLLRLARTRRATCAS
jgi:LuxR family maltose regulon positive regulatory protein